ncbi:hypothetical protein LTR10_020586 [Elasticomyces elasticus]|uniref:Uncharacterized protein n=1 Tax=Exophiala sideris TaxID=1016849 RepID=A0ABR0JK44_9EURO|nr:hypothetical protein LTR10_020586 [Elasticomyces elasticus]KAK5035440.1 hypothetical protein LTS07_002878 [Exophiala sideris]KAK5066365.1 hypothetical protein LTR69_002884 [Exophiala sideris]KAK5187042.1 hypothetical protein LTR44_001049 [Eurotiomycetes sp. CCFEE 6388]
MASTADIEKSYMQKSTDAPIPTAQTEAFHNANVGPDGFEGIYGDTITDVRDMLRLGSSRIVSNEAKALLNI